MGVVKIAQRPYNVLQSRCYFVRFNQTLDTSLLEVIPSTRHECTVLSLPPKKPAVGSVW